MSYGALYVVVISVYQVNVGLSSPVPNFLEKIVVGFRQEVNPTPAIEFPVREDQIPGPDSTWSVCLRLYRLVQRMSTPDL